MAVVNEGARYEPIDTEYFCRRLFGQSARGMATALQSDGVWRQNLARAVRHLRRYVDRNIVFTDSVQRDEVSSLLDALQERAKIRQALLREQAIESALIELCLHLMGGAPNHWERRVVNQGRHFSLDHHRTAHYSQDAKQRARLIADACTRSPVPNGMTAKSAKAAIEVFRKMIYPRPRHQEFLEWFRTSHPDAYCSLLG